MCGALVRMLIDDEFRRQVVSEFEARDLDGELEVLEREEDGEPKGA